MLAATIGNNDSQCSDCLPTWPINHSNQRSCQRVKRRLRLQGLPLPGRLGSRWDQRRFRHRRWRPRSAVCDTGGGNFQPVSRRGLQPGSEWWRRRLSGDVAPVARLGRRRGARAVREYKRAAVFGTGDCQVSVDGSWWEAAADIAYSTASKEFLVVWQGTGIRGQRIALNGTLLGTNFGITDTSYHRDPAVVYNPTNNEFMVVFGGADATSAFAGFRRVAAGSGALLGTETLLNRAGAVYIAEVAYNSATNQYLAAWYQGGTYGRLIDAAGNLASNVVLLSTTVTAYDALGIDFNTASGTFMMVSHSTSSFQDGAVELSGAGAVPDVPIVATAALPATTGNFYPKIAARAGKAEWLLSTATGFAATTVQRLQSSASGGGTHHHHRHHLRRLRHRRRHRR